MARKSFLPSEEVAIWWALHPKEKAKAKDRQRAGGRSGGQASGKLPEASKSETRDKVATFVGKSGRTLEKQIAIVEAAEAEPLRASYTHVIVHKARIPQHIQLCVSWGSYGAGAVFCFPGNSEGPGRPICFWGKSRKPRGLLFLWKLGRNQGAFYSWEKSEGPFCVWGGGREPMPQSMPTRVRPTPPPFPIRSRATSDRERRGASAGPTRLSDQSVPAERATESSHYRDLGSSTVPDEKGRLRLAPALPSRLLGTNPGST